MTFVDTTFWVALQFGGDRHHGQAELIWRTEGGSPVTCKQVLS
ncbi:MAG: hypothetical protein ACRENX_07890 [Candidatus Dormibacteria bacterium]